MAYRFECGTCGENFKRKKNKEQHQQILNH